MTPPNHLVEASDTPTPSSFHPAWRVLTLVDDEATDVLRLWGVRQDILECPAEEFGLLQPIFTAKASPAIL